MNINLIGVGDKIVNLEAIALIEDLTDDSGPVALLTTNAGGTFELEGADAEALFARAALIMEATDALLLKMQQAAAIQGVPA